MEIALVEGTLAELDPVHLLNLRRRDARAEATTPPRHTIGEVLEASALVPSRQVGPELVTMHSQILLQDIQTGQRSTLTLCQPAEADPAVGRVSVLSPVGSALLGLRVGSVARWLSAAGDEKAAEIVAPLFQPQSSGDYAM